MFIGNVKKMVLNVFDKEKYVLNYEKLQLYLRVELRFEKIKRVLQFSHSQWVNSYVKINTQKKKKKEKEKIVTKLERCCKNY